MNHIEETTNKEEEKYVFRHPFSDFIMSAPLPNGFRHLKIEQYDGSSDPEDHLAMFNVHTLLYGDTVIDPIKCRAFPSTLTSYALRWFFTLPPLSINTFSDLATKFLSRFVLSKTHRKDLMALTYLEEQRPDESLKDYINRFNREAIQIDNLNPKYLMTLLQVGLKAGPFKESIALKQPLNIDDLRQRATLYIAAEEGEARKRHEERRRERDDHSRRRSNEEKRKRYYRGRRNEYESKWSDE